MSVRFKSVGDLASSMGVSVKDIEKKISASVGGRERTKQLCTPNTEFSVYPPRVPQAILHRELVAKYGRYFNGGEIVYELQKIIPTRKYEADIAMPRFKVAIEMDGWRSHGLSKDGFKRDREKWLLFATFGWLVIPISREQIMENLTEVVALIDKCVKQRQRVSAVVEDKKGLIGAIYKGI